ncbi:hypothetical protein A1OO_08130 [Enterovibrio norvegicus FF-33]|uniref:hypothetical protein n=1 Tax=Enterovibrio norvegicus TaxID=188144 RepID=UPI0002EF4C4C|nr:hypothetical protein [Enterovibrio norvegicus]OEE65768.1 hypothetical protein A1OO_08130 [Enterovibrio norvegicus FF-33]OEE82258.1 hypothetical protein A1OQ_04245 [Enterovibrio norvegicus FF-162]
MDSQLYLVINTQQPLGQRISKRLAEKGNIVVYLTDDDQEGYAIAAEEPRVRYRYCSPKNQAMLAEEIEWTQRCVSLIDGIVVMVSESEIEDIQMPLDERFFSCARPQNTSSELSQEPLQELSITYVIVAQKPQAPDSLKALHLALCSRAHDDEKCNGFRVNYVLVSLNDKDEEDNDTTQSDIATSASNLTHYLTSQQAKAVHRQAFYFKNSSD